MEECRYEYMYPNDFIRAVEKLPVFIVPTGLLEWHANHLPLGQDTLKAYGICLETARKLGGGIVLPPNYFGRPGFSTYAGTLTYSEETLYPLFYDYLGQLKKVGARVIVVITGHYGHCQVDFIKKVTGDFNLANPDVKVIGKPEYEGVEVDGQVPADHAGKWESSMFWALYPDNIRWETYDTRMNDMKIYHDAPLDYFKEPADWDFKDDLRKSSSPELGRKAIDAITDAIVAEINNALHVLNINE